MVVTIAAKSGKFTKYGIQGETRLASLQRQKVLDTSVANVKCCVPRCGT